MSYTTSQLAKWRRLLLKRDAVVVHHRPGERPVRLWQCPLCGPNTFHRATALQAHHIYPKALYPDQALLLSNGALICSGHHQGEVHDFNAGADTGKPHEEAGWYRWRRFLAEHASDGYRYEFNQTHQVT